MSVTFFHVESYSKYDSFSLDEWCRVDTDEGSQTVSWQQLWLQLARYLKKSVRKWNTYQVWPQKCPSPICFLECSPILYKETLQWLRIRVKQRERAAGAEREQFNNVRTTVDWHNMTSCWDIMSMHLFWCSRRGSEIHRQYCSIKQAIDRDNNSFIIKSTNNLEDGFMLIFITFFQKVRPYTFIYGSKSFIRPFHYNWDLEFAALHHQISYK